MAKAHAKHPASLGKKKGSQSWQKRDELTINLAKRKSCHKPTLYQQKWRESDRFQNFTVWKAKPRDDRRKGEGRLVRAQSRLAEEWYEKGTHCFFSLFKTDSLFCNVVVLRRQEKLPLDKESSYLRKEKKRSSSQNRSKEKSIRTEGNLGEQVWRTRRNTSQGLELE